MPNLPIENVGRFGLLTDKKPYELEVEAWSQAQNMRFSALGAQKFTGHKLVYATTMLHDPFWLFPWLSTAAPGFSWLYPSLTRMARILGTSHVDVTRFTTSLGDDDYTADIDTLWSGTLLGDLVIWCYNKQADPPQTFNIANDRFEDIANWQTNTFVDILTVVDRHVVALRVKRDGIDFNPRMVKWSQAADPGTYPNSWDETDPATGAGEVTLAETPGEIMSVALLGNSTLIYKDDSVSSMRFVGGQNIFSFNTIFSEFGALSRESVGILENSHVVVTEGDVLLHNGQTFKSVIDKRNRNLLFKFMSASLKGKTQVKVYEQLTEVWICYCDVNSLGQLNKALIWNYLDNTWSQRDLQEFSYVAIGFIDTISVGQRFDDISGTFDTDLGAFDETAAAPVFDELLAADVANRDLLALNFTEQFNGVNMFIQLERTGLAIVGRDRQGGWRIDLDSTKFVRRVHLKMVANGPVDVYVGAQQLVGGPVAWTGPFSFDPNTQSFFDCRINTRFFNFKIESEADITWTLHGYTIDLSIIGEAPRQ